MRRILFGLLLFATIPAFAQYHYGNLDLRYELSENDSKAYTYENLRLYPIVAKKSFTDTIGRLGKYTSLRQALEQKKVIIMEQIDGATVNKLTIENISKDTILVMAGEVITGGKQNRIIGKDLLLIPGSGRIDISVFCVEAGRWENATTGTNNFKGYFNVGSFGLRKVVEKEQSQAAVWDKVNKLNTANGTSNSTSTYTAIESSPEFTKKLKAYTEHFKSKLLSDKNVIGVVIVTGDKVLGCDMFASHGLFAQNFENLLASYSTEAILNGSKVNIHSSKVKLYMDQLLESETKQATTIKSRGTIFLSDGKKLRVSSY